MTTATSFNELATLYERFTTLWEQVDGSVQSWVSAALDKTLDPGMHESANADGPWTPVHEVSEKPVRQWGFARGLDIGCGTGRYSVMLKQRCMSVVGIDPAGDMLTIARKERGLEGIRYQRQTLGEHNGDPYHYVLSVRALHHAGHPDVVLPQVKRLVAPGGRLVVVDMVNPGGWETPEFHRHRAERMSTYAVHKTGQGAAFWVTRDLLLNPAWLRSVVADVPLPAEEFHDTYARHFPLVVTYQLDEMTRGAVWDAPTTPPRERPALDANGDVRVTETAPL